LDVLSGSAIPKAEDGESTIDWKVCLLLIFFH